MKILFCGMLLIAVLSAKASSEGTDDPLGKSSSAPTPAPTPLWPRATLTLPGSAGILQGTRSGLYFHPAAAKGAPPDFYAKGWQQLALPGEKADGVIALCQDLQGRLWCGRERSGVTVGVRGNDGAWTFRPYPVGSGPLGAHVSSIACDPERGDMWLVHESGITVYRIFKPRPGQTKADPPRWQHLGRLFGLPSDHLKCVAFLPKGKPNDPTVVIGTEFEGLILGRDWPGDPKWSVVPGPRDPAGKPLRMPDAPSGAGLPSPIVNAVATSRSGWIFAATDTGLAWSQDRGATFRFVRGQDWKKKVEAIREPADWKVPALREMPRLLSLPEVDVHGPYPQVLFPKIPGRMPDLLPEDYLQSLALDGAGRLWIGCRTAGVQAFEPRNMGALGAPQRFKGSSYADGFAPDGAAPAVALRGGGLQPLAAPTGAGGLGRTDVPPLEPWRAAPAPIVGAAPPREPPSFPVAAAAPDLVDWHTVMQAVDAFRVQPMEVGDAVALPDDWTTRGDWQGRVGTAYMLQYAACSPHDYMWGEYEPKHGFPYAISHIGTNHEGNDGIRNWAWVGEKSDPRAMEMPNEFMERGRIKEPRWHKLGRRAGGTDDHAEAYPWNHDGPHVYVTFKVPEGRHVLSCYFMNWDGESASNCCRDYRLDLRINRNFNGMFMHGFGLEETLALGRVHDWDSGVYKRFLVQGPCRMTLWVDKNHSFNTMVMATGFQPLTDRFPPYWGSWDDHLAWTKKTPGARPALPYPLSTDTAKCPDLLWACLDWLENADPVSFATRCRPAFEVLLRHERAWLAKAAVAPQPDAAALRLHQERLARACHFLGLYPEREAAWAARGWTTPRSIQRTLPWDGTYGPRGNPASVGLRVLTEHLAKRPLPEDQRAPWAGVAEPVGH